VGGHGDYSTTTRRPAEPRDKRAVTEKNRDEQLEELGKRIAKVRRSKGLTIERLAYEIGISKGNLSDIENGKKDPRFTTLWAIAEGLELAISQLLKEL
jgi:DNA-binding XRE family transcriptional regulator